MAYVLEAESGRRRGFQADEAWVGGVLWHFLVVAWSQTACGALAKSSWKERGQESNGARKRPSVRDSGSHVGNDGSEINSIW